MLLVDKQGRLFARLSDSILVRDGYEKQYEQLKLLGSALTLELLQAMQKRVAHSYEMPVLLRNVHIFDPQSRDGRGCGVAGGFLVAGLPLSSRRPTQPNIRTK